MIFDSPEANQRLSDTAAEAPPATFMERFHAADKQGQLRGTVLSPGFAVSEDYDRRIKDIKDAGLGDLSDLNPMWNSKATQRAPHVYSEGHSIYDMEPSKAGEDPHEAFQKKLEELAQKYPDKAHIIKADKPITGSESYQAAKKAAEDAAAAYGGPPLTGPIADFAGGMYSMRKDPFQVGTLVIGPMSPVRQGAKAVLTMGLKQAAANAAVEATMQPFVQSWRKSMNDSYGWWAAAEEIGMAGAFGLGADAGVRMLYRGAQARLGRKAVLDEQGRVVGYESGAASAEREALNARNLEIQKNLEALPKDTLDKVAQGDEEATIALAKALKADEDPSVGGAINALRNTDRVTLDGIDDGWRERSLIQQLRALEDPSEPAPAHFDAATKAERPRLADDAELPKGTEGNQHYRMLDLDGKPVRFEAVDVNRITTDPATFQFKGGRDAAGASNALRAVDFDGRYKGKVIVYEREDGSLVVADGHDRVSLANRAPEPQKLDALIFREKDGWTAEQVRAEAARKNIQEGTGSLMDVAGAIRRHPEIVDDSMAVSTDFMADARSIARLSDEAFDAVAGGQFNPKHGVLVSDHVPDQSRHMEVLRELDRRNPPTEAAARREIGNMLREPANIETLTRVMDIPLAEPHVLEARNDVLAGVMTTLRQEPGYIGEIETQAIAAVIRRLAEKPGLVSDTLAQAGRAVAEGQPIERAIDATLRRFEDVIGKAGVKGLADQPVRLASISRGLDMRADLDRKIEAIQKNLSYLDTSNMPGVKAERDATAALLEKLKSGEVPPLSLTRTDSAAGILESKAPLMQRALGRTHFYNITADGVTLGDFAVTVAPIGSRAFIESIHLTDALRAYAGTSLLRQLRTLFHGEFPQVTTFYGDRSTGAHAKSGKPRQEVNWPSRRDDQGLILFALSGSDAAVGRSMRADLDRLGYYSKALEAARGLKQAKGTPEQMLAQLKAAGVKDAEIEATNLRGFLDGKTSITRDEIVKHLTEHRVGVNESKYGGAEPGRRPFESRDAAAQYAADIVGADGYVLSGNTIYESRPGIIGNRRGPLIGTIDDLGGGRFYLAQGDRLSVNDVQRSQIPDDATGRSKWINYSLDPSNPTYRETVLHLPEAVPSFDEYLAARIKKGTAWEDPSPDNLATYRADYERGDWRNERSRDYAAVRAAQDTNFRSGHFSEPNIIGHMMTSLNKHEGKPVFTLDQIQSDWGQKLRDGGVRDEAKIAELKAKLKEVVAKHNPALDAWKDFAMKLREGRDPVDWLPTMSDGDLSGGMRKAENWFASNRNTLSPEQRADFQRLFMGLEYGRRDVSLISAELHTAERSAPGHPLVNTTDQWVNTTLRRALRQAVEADAEFVAIPHGDTVLSYNPGDEGGMRGFYGSRTSEGIVPKNLRKLLEKIDKDSAKPVKVEKLETPSGMLGFADKGIGPYPKWDYDQTGFTLFPLTDRVKRSVMEEGQPLFAKPAENITPTKLNEFAENLRQALDEATTPPPGRLDDPIKDAPKQVERLREDLAEDIAVAMGQPSPAQLAAIRAFHGSPHDFDKFDISKIGTGEGAQAYGFGLYFAENEGVAKSYRNTLGTWGNEVKRRASDQLGLNLTDEAASNFQAAAMAAQGDPVRAAKLIQMRVPETRTLPTEKIAEVAKQLHEVDKPGRLYEVNIKADPEHFLDWDKPLSQQSEKVKRAFDTASDRWGDGSLHPENLSDMTIREWYKFATVDLKLGNEWLTKFFDGTGVTGIRYLDQASRGAGEGSRNFVVFDDSLVEIVAKDGKPVTPEEKKNILADMRRQQAEERAAKQQAEQPQQPAQASPLLDLYQRYVTQGREALDAVMPGTGRMIDEFVQANPEVVSRIAEALGAPTGRPQAAQMLEQAMPQFMSPRVMDMSKPVLLTPEANARMREIRTAIDETVKMLPPEYRIRVEDSLVFNFGDGDKRLDGLHDGYEKLIYVSMAAGDPVRTSRHEVIHALRQSGLMKDEEFSALYKFADRLGLRKAYEIDAQYKEPYTQAYGNRGADFVEQLLREETVANMFSDYSLNGRRFGDVAGGGMVDRLIDMIVSFMKQVRDIMGGYGFRNVYDVFESIESGAMARRGMGDAPEASRLAMFAGENAKTADLEALSKAKQMDSEGKPREAIWTDTGWFKGVDGKWRFEISDHNANLDLKGAISDGWEPNQRWPADHLFNHQELFAAYPAMRDTGIQYRPFPANLNDAAAAFGQRGNLVSLNSGYRDFANERTMQSFGLHELQHVVQSIEEMARGGNSSKFTKEMLEAERARIAAEQAARPKLDDWTAVDNSIAPADMTDVDLGRSLYRRLAGEAEARLVQKRMNMTPEERRARPPWLDYDVPEADQIVRMANEAIQMSLEDKPLARDLADVQRDRDAADLVGACRA